MTEEQKKQVEDLLPVKLADGRVLYSQGVKAGRWIFATGHLATDFKSGLSPAVVDARLPRFGKPKNEKEGDLILKNLSAVAEAGGSQLSNVVRLDQYYTTWKAVDLYHSSRVRAFGDYISPSTSILQKGLLFPEAEIEVNMIAIVPDEAFSIQKFQPLNIDVPKKSGFTPIVRVGDYVFIAGQLASDEKGGVSIGIAPEARVTEGWLWQGTAIKLQTDYIIRRKLEPALAAAGSSLANVVKAQVYMSDVDDFPAFNEIWAQYFPKDPPVTTLVPAAKPGFGAADAIIEINILALADEGKTSKEMIDADVFTGYDNQSVAIRAGDLLFISGLMGIDKNGLVPEARVDARQPYFSPGIQGQMNHILQSAQKICRAAGTSLENIVRIQQFHTDLNAFYPAHQVWQQHLPGRHLPFSAIQVPEPLPVPGSTVLMDLWVYAP